MTWEEDWEIAEGAISRRGGQGHVVKVIHRDSRVVGALKQMHSSHQKNSERRQRMAREVTALQRLHATNVPAVLDHNVTEVDDVTVPLYFVAEWIEGHTLQDKFGGKPPSLREALTLTRNLAGIVMHCHKNAVIHRDIKPTNVLTRVDTNELYLIDFGIAYSDSPDEAISTEIRQELGNRFLRLPGLAAGSAKRDPRDDLTLLVGVLFFLITGRNPRPNLLLDDEGRPPHKRASASFPEEATRDPAWKRIMSIFDVGFNVNVGFRFQSASDLIEMLDEASTYESATEEATLPYEEELEALETLRQQIDAAIDEVETALTEALNLLLRELGALCRKHGFAPAHPQAKITQYGREAKMLWTVRRADSREPYVHTHLFVTLEGDERSYVTIRMETPAHEQLVFFRKTYYQGLAADLARLREEAVRSAEVVFANAIRLLLMKAEAIEKNRRHKSP